MDKSKTFNTDLVGAIETDFLIDASLALAAGAIARTESRGAQARTDFPERDDETGSNTRWRGASPTARRGWTIRARSRSPNMHPK